MNGLNVVSPDQWLVARRALLQKEKELTKLNDELALARRALPCVRVETPYTFDGPSGRQTLSDLFSGRSQLVIYHFMFGPGWKEGCPSCSLLADHLNPCAVHLAARDVSVVMVSRAPYGEIAAFQKRMGWSVPWVSSFGSNFNRDYRVLLTPEELQSSRGPYNYGDEGFPSQEAPGLSVFCKDEHGAVFHTYSAYARGAEPMLGVYSVLDMVPKGRNEEGLPWPMAWVRHHDRYDSTETKTAPAA